VQIPELLALIAVFFLTSGISVVTGSTSLVTVPVMIAFGIEPHRAIATNMLALTFMSAGGSLPFAGKRILSRSHLPGTIALTVVGSALGALLMIAVPVKALQIVVGIAMLGVAVFSLFHKPAGAKETDVRRGFGMNTFGYITTFLLAIYGGFFSGGYVTLLTVAFVILFGMTFLQAVATTKVVNIFSSGIATIVFLRRGMVDIKLGVILGIVMFMGALLGGRIVLRLSSIWLRRIFVATVLLLAIRMVVLSF
jgi:uncharacterized protein